MWSALNVYQVSLRILHYTTVYVERMFNFKIFIKYQIRSAFRQNPVIACCSDSEISNWESLHMLKVYLILYSLRIWDCSVSIWGHRLFVLPPWLKVNVIFWCALLCYMSRYPHWAPVSFSANVNGDTFLFPKFVRLSIHVYFQRFTATSKFSFQMRKYRCIAFTI